MADFFSDNFFIHRVLITLPRLRSTLIFWIVLSYERFFYSSCAKITHHALYTDDRDLRLRCPNKIVKLFWINLQLFSIDKCFVDMATVLVDFCAW